MSFEDYSFLVSHLKSFKDLSYDDQNNEYMTESQKEAHCFDDVVQEFYLSINQGGSIPKSNDALFYENGNNAFIFIEFKNGNINNKKSKKIIAKNKKSIVALKQITNNTIDSEFVKSNGQYILVYNIDNIGDEEYKTSASDYLYKSQINSSNSRGYIFSTIAKKSLTLERPILFGLECIGQYYKHMVTLEKSEFNRIVDDLTPDYSLEDNL